MSAHPALSRLGLALGIACALAARVALAAPPSDTSRTVRRTLDAPPTTSLDGAALSADAAVDVLHYDFNLAFDVAADTFDGIATVQILARQDGVAAFGLDLVDSLLVTDVTVDGTSASFEHLSDRLAIVLPTRLDTGGEASVSITYGGWPMLDGDGNGLVISPGLIWSVNEPAGARTWLPCVDDPSDKASVTMEVRVPTSMTAVSNGLPVGAPVDHGDGTQSFVYDSTEPMATYLIAVTARSFARWEEDAGGVPLVYYAYPQDESRARASWSGTRTMLEAFSELFGPYPFASYGMVETPLDGAMEHQTMTTMGAVTLYVTGDGLENTFVSHELAHQWWGDWVTPESWNDIWLNEGFATYSEALLWEWATRQGLTGETDAAAALADYVAGIRSYYLTRRPGGDDPSPIYAPLELLGTTVYDKGALVLHMLRYLLGDDGFLTLLRTYGAEHAYGNVTTTDFEAAAEAVYGGSLAWFFDEWVYGTGIPHLGVTWQASGGGLANGVTFAVKQLQSGASFRMPIPVRLHTEAGVVDREVWLEGDAFVPATLQTLGRVTDVEVDPERWLLMSAAVVDADATGEGCNCRSSPSGELVWLAIFLVVWRRRRG